MTLKIKLNHILLGLAVVMLMLSTNAVAIAQVGETDGTVPGTSSRETNRGDRAPMVVPGGPGHLMLSAHDFHPESMDMDWSYFADYELYNPGTEEGPYMASVHLPDGATVNQLVMYFFDDVEKNLYIEFVRLETGGVTPEGLAGFIVGGTPGYSYGTDTSIDNALINLANYSYYVKVYIPSGGGDGLTLLQVRIDYDYPTFLPTVLK